MLKRLHFGDRVCLTGVSDIDGLAFKAGLLLHQGRGKGAGRG